MSKRTFFTTMTPLPAGITRETVLETLHSHTEMIDLNPLVEERHPIKPPNNATAEEYHCVWYSLTDKVQYLPGGLMSGKVTYDACFHDLENGLQTHIYAPMGLNIRGKWTLGGSLPGEPVAPVELGLGAPLQGLWLREDVDMRCNVLMTSFVKKTLKKAHSKLVDRLLVKAQIVTAATKNQELTQGSSSYFSTESDTASFSSENNPNSPPFARSSPELADHPTFRGRTSSDNMVPRPLSVRSNSPSFSSSFMSNTTGRSSYTNEGSRVSWQALNAPPARSPPVQNTHAVYQQQPNNTYYHGSPASPPYPSSAVDTQSGDSRQQNLRPLPVPAKYDPAAYAAYQNQHIGPVELE